MSFRSSLVSRVGPHLAAAAFAILFSQLVFRAIGFRYNPFRDPFNFGLLLIDVGMYLAWYIGFDALLSRAAPAEAGPRATGE